MSTDAAARAALFGDTADKKAPPPAAGKAADAGAVVLPEGWVAKKDDNTGKTYYYNKTTKETSWKLPPGSTTSSTAASTAAPAAADPNALPPDWVEKKDDKSGKTYYYNKKTKETSWKKPANTDASAAASTSPAPVAAAADPNALPEGWTEHVDKKSGKPYYVNKKTKETRWDRPTNAAEPAGASKENEKPASDADTKPEVTAAAAAVVAAPAAATPVAKKWVPPPPPASFPPPPPSSRNPAGKLLSATPQDGSSRSSSHLSSNDSGKANGWRNLSKAQWLEELERRMGGSVTASRQQLLLQQGQQPGAGGAASGASSPPRDLTEREIARLTAQGVTVSAQETLQELTRVKTEGGGSPAGGGGAARSGGGGGFLDFRDGATQTVFAPPTADVGVATLHAASNIAELVPIPDAGNLACATLESLRREQDKALTLLQHVQGTLAAQMQEAGVAFAGHGSTRQLRLNIAKKPAASARGEENETAALARELAPAYRSLHLDAISAASGGARTWRFADEHEGNALYDEHSMKKAQVVEELSSNTNSRHAAFQRHYDAMRSDCVLRERIHQQYQQVNANSFVDVADFANKLAAELLAKLQKSE